MKHNCHTCGNGQREKGICEAFTDGNDATQREVAEWIMTVAKGDVVPSTADGCPCWKDISVVENGLNIASMPLTGSEALYAFAGWITSLDASITAGRKHDAAVWARLVQKFVAANNLGDLRPGWDKLIRHPIGTTRDIIG